ncbi:MAG: TetR/AcrR family transcriptional regulator [Lachnospiraceae bacterium]|nr:TetR/AcrR family transcriptional regulator [Lachnospiraceae bacterium]
MTTEKENATLRAINDAMEDLLRYKPLESIRVSDICAACGINRQLFYYYYRDKYDCINSRYKNEANRIFAEMAANASAEDMAFRMLDYMKQHKDYYAAAFHYGGQNSFFHYCLDYSYSLNSTVVSQRAAVDGQKVDAELDFGIRFFNSACLQTTSQWACSGMAEEAKYLAKMMFRSAPAPLQAFYRERDT